MDDAEQKAIDALRAAGLEAEARAVELLRGRHRDTMDAYEAGQRASFKAGQVAERERLAALPLTVERINTLWDGHTVPAFGRIGISPIVFARVIERAHGIVE